MVVVASFSKVCVVSENDPSAQQRYHSCFQIFPLWSSFSKVCVFRENNLALDHFNADAAR